MSIVLIPTPTVNAMSPLWDRRKFLANKYMSELNVSEVEMVDRFGKKYTEILASRGKALHYYKFSYLEACGFSDQVLKAFAFKYQVSSDSAIQEALFRICEGEEFDCIFDSFLAMWDRERKAGLKSPLVTSFPESIVSIFSNKSFNVNQAYRLILEASSGNAVNQFLDLWISTVQEVNKSFLSKDEVELIFFVTKQYFISTPEALVPSIRHAFGLEDLPYSWIVETFII